MSLMSVGLIQKKKQKKNLELSPGKNFIIMANFGKIIILYQINNTIVGLSVLLYVVVTIFYNNDTLIKRGNYKREKKWKKGKTLFTFVLMCLFECQPTQENGSLKRKSDFFQLHSYWRIFSNI